MIYLDNNATTISTKKHLQELLLLYEMHKGNPSSPHQFGRSASVGISETRKKIASLLGVDSGEIIFTSGATEANNFVMKSFQNCHVITTNFEHSSVYEPLRNLEYLKCVTLDTITVDLDSSLFLSDVLKNIHKETRLISFLAAHNETGHILPVFDLADFLNWKRWGKKSFSRDLSFYENLNQYVSHHLTSQDFQNIHFHIDGVQAFGKIETQKWMHEGIDSCSLSAHKVGGISGIGALFLRRGRKLISLIEGGPQEKKRRAGTENLIGILSFHLVCDELFADGYWDQVLKMNQLRLFLYDKLSSYENQIEIHSPKNVTLPNTIFFSFKNKKHKNEDFIVHCDLKGICISSGSACSSGVHLPSRSVLSLGKSEFLAKNTIRVSLSKENTQEEILEFLEVLNFFL